MAKLISAFTAGILLITGCTLQEDGISHFVSTIDDIDAGESVIMIDCSFLVMEEGENNGLEYIPCYVDAEDVKIVNEAGEELSVDELSTGTDIEVELEEVQPPALIEGDIEAERLIVIQ